MVKRVSHCQDLGLLSREVTTVVYAQHFTLSYQRPFHLPTNPYCPNSYLHLPQAKTSYISVETTLLGPNEKPNRYRAHSQVEVVVAQILPRELLCLSLHVTA